MVSQDSWIFAALGACLWLSCARPDAPSAPAEPGADASVRPATYDASAASHSASDAGRAAVPSVDPKSDAGSGASVAEHTQRDAGPLQEADASSAPVLRASIHNGGFWSDDRGQRIEAHGGGFIQVADTYYWFGEDKSANGAGFKAVNCYASADLTHWQFRAAVVTPSTAAELAASDRIIERPKVLYNEHTRRYVMWLHWEGKNYAEAKAGVFGSEKVDGPYKFESAFRPNANMSRDDTLFRDDDGKAYFLSAANENADLVLYALSDDYLTVERQVATLFAGSKREAPALFKDRGRYYLITSAATGWDSNQAKYTSASAIEGPWAALTNLGDATTFDTQPAYVIPIHGSARTTYLYAGDRWQDPDLQSSKYIWLPLELSDDGQLSLSYVADFQLDLTTGQWSAEDGFLPQQAWRLVRADSEETSAADGRGSRAFDGQASTFWHTQYTNAAPAPPHELQIDLGARYSLTAMRYLPRQDGNDHGVVADYELYVSEDGSQWGAAVSAGKFAASFEPKLVSFPARSGRYVRFVAKSEIHGQPWSSMAELDLSGTPL